MNAITPWVIKIGGAILEQKSALSEFLSAIKKIKADTNTPVVLVHGGGVVVDQMLAAANFTTTKVNGLRVTPAEQIPTIVGALAGTVNKTIVAGAQLQNLSAVGLSLLDGNSVICQPAISELACVGLPQPADSTLLSTLLANQFLPVISSIGVLGNGQLVNVNADDAAVAIAKLINAELVFLTDVKGVKGADGEYLTELSQQDATTLIADGVISGGMTAKVNAAFLAAAQLNRAITVASWQAPQQIIDLVLGKTTGTRIQPS